MELDHALTLFVLVTAVASGRVAIKNRAWPWLAIQAVNVAVLGLAWLLARGQVALYAGPVWFLTVLAPGLSTTLADRFGRAERFRVAAVFATIARTLHPNALTKLRARVITLQRLETEGRVDEARALAREIAEGPALMVARLIELRIDHRWDEAVAFIEAQPPELLAKDPSVASFYLRALGEVGDVERLLTWYRDARAAAGHPQALGTLMLFVAAFGGLEATTERILWTQHPDMPEDGKELWRLTAAMAAGRDVSADLARLEASARPRIATAARRRRESPLVPVAMIELSAEAREALADVQRAADALEPVKPASPTACAGLALVNLFAFAREIPGGTTSAVNLHRLGALYTGDVLMSEWYRLATATVLHYGALHVAMNILGLMVLGPRLEAAIGRARFVLLYVASGVAANALEVAWTTKGSGTPALLVGASGSVMGVAGALLVHRALHWRRLRTPLARREVLSLVMMFVLQIGFDAVTPRVAGAVHMFGALAGGLLALVVARPRGSVALPPPVDARARRRVRAAAAIAIAAGCGLVELGFRAASSDSAPSGECSEGDLPSCVADCEAVLGKDVLDGGAPAPSDRFRGARRATMLQSCNRLAYAVSNAPDAGPDDLRRAYALYAATCTSGSMLGCTNEGVMLERGEGSARDRDAAAERYARACDAGHARGCTYLGDALFKPPFGVAHARRVFAEACDGGDAVSCRELERLDEPEP